MSVCIYLVCYILVCVYTYNSMLKLKGGLTRGWVSTCLTSAVRVLPLSLACGRSVGA